MERPDFAHLRHEILMARQRVYRVHGATPLDCVELEDGTRVYLKREDLGPIHAYKWRGAFNRISLLSPAECARGVITASAGNHAQGVALAARRCGTTARIYMPVTTPATKKAAVQRHGGDCVEIILIGETFGQAAQAAAEDQLKNGRVFVSAYDDPLVMGGQGTIADEIILSGDGPFDTAFLQIGGGGMAAAVAFWLKENFPGIRIIGVEGEGQASFAAALQAGYPVALKTMDIFCDGTAIPCVGQHTFPILRACIDEVMTVSNDEVCHAIQRLWSLSRCVCEPSGAMGLAGLLKRQPEFSGSKSVAILCGANIDFHQLAYIARRAPFGSPHRHTLRIRIGEAKGELNRLLTDYFPDFNIVDFQYGQHHPEIAFHVIGFEANDAELQALQARLQDSGIPYENISGRTDVRFRVIPFRSELMAHPVFARLEFSERPGAIRDILQVVAPHARLCYFNYVYTGERIGRALVGFDFETRESELSFLRFMKENETVLQAFHPLSARTMQRILA